MRPAAVVRRGAEYLEHHGVESPQANAERLMLAILGTDRTGLLARVEGLTAAEAKAYGRALCRRCAGTPLQHLTGEEGFRHLVLRVRAGVFIPRPETEVLVEVALQTIAGVRDAAVADVGTGTGAIALSIALEHPGARVWATDAAPEAVSLASENVVALGLEVTVLTGDLLTPLPRHLHRKLDLVVSNPPYVPDERRALLTAEVLADPDDALFGGPEVYRRLFAQAAEWLRPHGHVVVEIDDEAGPTARELALAAGFVDVAVLPDLAGRPRVVRGRRP